MLKRGQSAMEYLLTYGWAILIVLISLSLLFYLGVFSPKTPNTCMGTAPLVCGDVKVMAASGDLGGVAIFSVGASGTSGEDISEVTLNGEACDISGAGDLSWSDNSMVTFACGTDLELNEGDKASGEFSFTYTPSYGGVSHTTKNSFSGGVESCGSVDGSDCFGFEDLTKLQMIGCGDGLLLSGVSCDVNECAYTCLTP